MGYAFLAESCWISARCPPCVRRGSLSDRRWRI